MIVSAITQNLKDRLETLSTYGGTPVVELERLVLNINNRYPYMEICGPIAEVEQYTRDVADTKLTYQVNYYHTINDESEVENTEVTYLTRNVVADIIRHIMNDQSRGGRAQKTKPVSYGYSMQVSQNNTIEFVVYVIIEITALIDSANPYLIG